MKSSHISTSSSRTSAIPAQRSVLSTATTQSTSTSTTVTSTATSSSSALLPSSSKLVSETLDCIKKGDEIIEKQKTKENIVMVLGPTGTGKGTLINYLSGTALKPVYQDGTWKLSAEKTLPGISISHSRQSDTFYPAIHSPADKNFSYIDSPGFGDSRGVAHDIATAYFRQKIMGTKEIKSMKIALTLPYKDFSGGRGDIVKGYINALDQFLQLNKNAKHINELKQAITLVITQADPPRFSIEELNTELNARREKTNKELSDAGVSEKARVDLINKLLADDIKKFNESLQEVSNTPTERKGTIVNAFKEQGGIELEAKKVFDHLAQASNFEIFSKPIIVSQEKAVMVSGEREQILRLIDKSRYIDKSKIEIGLTVSPDSKLVVIDLAKDVNNTIGEEVKKAVTETINACKQKIGESHEFDSLKAYLSSKLCGLQEVITSMDSKPFNPEAFSRSLDSKFSNTQEIKKHIVYIDFFKKLDSNIGYEVEIWNRAFQDLHKQIAYLLTPQKPEFPNNVLTIKGSLLSLKDHLAVDQYVKAIKIYATDKVFLDQDLQHDKLKGVSLAIIAPNWEVVGNKRVIDLSGKDGTNYAFKAENGLPITVGTVDRYGSGIAGKAGVDGIPGKPGSSGGNFFGLGKKYSNLDHLTVKVSGGKGGKGQDGGDGSDGSNGNSGSEEMVKARSLILKPARQELGFADKEGASWVVHGAKKLGTFNSQFLETYTSEGAEGGKGGDAGKGGVGGKGGLRGNVKIIDCKQNLGADYRQFACIEQEGQDGDKGADGKAGTGGKNGITYTGKYVSEEVLPAFRGRGETSEVGGVVGVVGAVSSASANTAMQLGVVTPAQIAAQQAAKEAFTQTTKQIVKKTMEKILTEAAQTGIANASGTTAKEIMKQVGQQLGKEAMQAVGKEAAKEIAMEASKTVLAEAAALKVATWTFTEGGKHIAKQVGAELTKEVASEAAKGSMASAAVGFATSLGVSLAIQGAMSVVSAYASSGWQEEPHDTGDSGKAKDGKTPTEKNAQNIERPQPSQKFTTQIIKEFQEYYKTEVGNPFIDQGVLGELAGIDMQLSGNDL